MKDKVNIKTMQLRQKTVGRHFEMANRLQAVYWKLTLGQTYYFINLTKQLRITLYVNIH